jgi:hypothetical protein
MLGHLFLAVYIVAYHASAHGAVSEYIVYRKSYPG